MKNTFYGTRLARYGAWATAATDDTSDKTLARQLPVISEEFTSSTSMKLKGKKRDEAASLWDIEDDVYLTELIENLPQNRLHAIKRAQ